MFWQLLEISDWAAEVLEVDETESGQREQQGGNQQGEGYPRPGGCWLSLVMNHDEPGEEDNECCDQVLLAIIKYQTKSGAALLWSPVQN